ncbi:hypothetical protein [Micromonospora sediminicola]|uniref:hypothetical protein n=1 Tax=Micromonospora sediminicola TaxID=946078 RepID=UPI0037A76913
MEKHSVKLAMEGTTGEPWRRKLADRDWLRRQVGTRGVRQIAAEIGCGPSTVQRAVKRHEIDTRAEQRAAKIAPLIGRRFGALTVREEAPPVARSGNLQVRADCDCGGSKVISILKLEQRLPGWDHCGCQSKARWSAVGKSNREHGHRRPTPSPTYRSWQAMRDRCYRPSTNGYASFGGRGIEVCDRWRDNFGAFLHDMGERPEGMTLDRINVDGNYTPDNCRWATPSQQIANRRLGVWLSADHWDEIEAALEAANTSASLSALKAVRRARDGALRSGKEGRRYMPEASRLGNAK